MFLCAICPMARGSERLQMNIKILYDNTAIDGYVSGWGFSVLVDDETMFDTGESEEGLMSNMRKFGVEPSQIKQIILSHEDWDHVGGIGVLKQCGAIDVYLPAGVSCELKKTIEGLNSGVTTVEAGCETSIDKSKFVTATLGEDKKEVSLAVRTNKGLVLITGCAHPGLDKIMDAVRTAGDIYAVVGGFHGFDKLELLADIPVIIPCHCTKQSAQILDMYPEQARLVAAGMEIHLGDNDE